MTFGTFGHAKVHKTQGTFRLSEKYEKEKRGRLSSFELLAYAKIHAHIKEAAGVYEVCTLTEPRR